MTPIPLHDDSAFAQIFAGLGPHVADHMLSVRSLLDTSRWVGHINLITAFAILLDQQAEALAVPGQSNPVSTELARLAERLHRVRA